MTRWTPGERAAIDQWASVIRDTGRMMLAYSGGRPLVTMNPMEPWENAAVETSSPVWPGCPHARAIVPTLRLFGESLFFCESCFWARIRRARDSDPPFQWYCAGCGVALNGPPRQLIRWAASRTTITVFVACRACQRRMKRRFRKGPKR